MGALVRQRTRWNQGFLQVLRKGVWRDLPTRRQRFLARYTLAMPFLQAFTGVLVPVSVLAILLLRVPVLLALLSFLPLLPTVLTIVAGVVGLRDYCRSFGTRARVRDYVRFVVGTPFYQLLLSYAAVRAAWREVRGQRGWEKTEHIGAHRPRPVLAAVEVGG